MARGSQVAESFSIGANGAVFRPRSYGLYVFRASNAEWLGVVNFGQQNFGGELLLLAKGSVEAGGDGLLDFGAGKSIGRSRKFLQIERTRIAAAFFQVNGEQGTARLRVRQIHKENFIEAALAQHLRRQTGNIVGGGRKKNTALMVLHPGEQRGQQALGQPCVGVPTRARGGESFFDFVNPHHDGREFLRELQCFVQAFFAFADVLVVKRSGIEPHQFDTPLSGDRARRHTFSATLHARNQHAFRRHQTKALSFRSQRVASFINPLAQVLESGDIEESGIAANRLQNTVRLKRGAFGVQHRIKKSGIGHAARKQAAAKRSRGLIFRQAHQIVRELCDGRSVESHEDAAIAAGLAQNLIHAQRQFVRIGQSQLKRNRIAFQFRWQFDRGRGDHDGAARGAKPVREVAQAAADAVVVAITRKVSEQKDGVAFNERDIDERLFGLGGAVEWRAADLRESGGHAPCIERHDELYGNGAQQAFESLLLRGFHSDDGIQRVDEQQQFIALRILLQLRRGAWDLEVVGQALGLDELFTVHDARR